ncbi:MAG TPA: hypothetical protein VEV38_07920 [Candidatus Eremiobacteraceae bacterium]|nr:hypothetical protein [Candidatus Eremiobacteraceae bacterium]
MQICESCCFVGYPETKAAGGGFGCFVEGLLWLFFIIPGLIYTVWRMSTIKKVCPKCGSHMIPLDSPRGRRLQMQLGISPDAR